MLGLCDDVLRRRMRTCVLSVSSTVSRSVCRSRHYVSALWCWDKNISNTYLNFTGQHFLYMSWDLHVLGKCYPAYFLYLHSSRNLKEIRPILYREMYYVKTYLRWYRMHEVSFPNPVVSIRSLDLQNSTVLSTNPTMIIPAALS